MSRKKVLLKVIVLGDSGVRQASRCAHARATRSPRLRATDHTPPLTLQVGKTSLMVQVWNISARQPKREAFFLLAFAPRPCMDTRVGDHATGDTCTGGAVDRRCWPVAPRGEVMAVASSLVFRWTRSRGGAVVLSRQSRVLELQLCMSHRLSHSHARST